VLINGSVFLVVWTFLLSGADAIGAQNTSKDLPPIIDVHHHAMDNNNGFSVGATCPNTSKFTGIRPKSRCWSRFRVGQRRVHVEALPSA